MPTVYSHSRLSVFEDCRLRYRLRYVDRVKREREGVEAFLGSRVHETLEALYRDVLMGRTPAADAVVEDFGRRWEERWNDAIVVRDPRWGPDDHRAAGEEALRRYYARHAPFRADRTLGLEVRVALELPGGARLEGYADRVARDPDGRIAIHDYKTSSILPTQADVDQDRQLALYQAGVERLWPGAPGVRLVWHYLRYDEILVSVRSREQMDATLLAAAKVVEQVESETEWRPTPSAMCDWCPYWDLCPEKRHAWELLQKGAVEASLLPNPAPAAEDATRAVDAAVAAIGRRLEAEADYEAAKERILAYARATGATVVRSGDASARIRDGEVRIVTPPEPEPGPGPAREARRTAAGPA
ncbi:MAG TPA: PD-(D/E)XK nuclease family protein [Planctomycetota bacterium]|nr:PD-(D/E)XK nuclease family protein [Planctomycetota bacterium]